MNEVRVTDRETGNDLTLVMLNVQYRLNKFHPNIGNSTLLHVVWGSWPHF